MAQKTPNFVIVFLRTMERIHLYVESDETSLYGTFTHVKENDSGVFVADQKTLEDYKKYVRIDFTYGNFNSDERRRPMVVTFEYPGELQAFGEKVLQGYARASLASPAFCTIEKIEKW